MHHRSLFPGMSRAAHAVRDIIPSASALLLCLLMPSVAGRAQTANRLHINEVMVANVDRFLDTSWNYGSWVEIYNSSDSEINLKRYYINTSDTKLDKIRIGYDLVIPAYGHGVLWFGHKYWQQECEN